jgi:hypothetical protein
MDLLYRRLVESYFRRRDRTLTSGAFYLRGKPDPEVSVDLARLTTPEITASKKPGSGVGQLRAEVPRHLGLDVRHDPHPETDPENAAHSVIVGMARTSIADKERCRRLAHATEILLYPDGV